MDEDALIEKMVNACLDGMSHDDATYEDGMRAALAVARAEILGEAALSVKNLQYRVKEDFDEGYNECCVDAEAAIRSLAKGADQ